jgi:rsbT co-antagonist protein RsbR
MASSKLQDIVARHEDALLSEWMQQQLQSTASRRDLIRDDELREQSQTFLRLLRGALQTDPGASDVDGAPWTGTREMLAELSHSRARLGFTPSETAIFVLSLKKPLFDRLRREVGTDAQALADEMWRATMLLDRLALFTTEIFLKGREEVIARGQRDMLELSTPVVELWDGVLALPLIGTLDSGRTSVVMENLLGRIVETGASIAILDITGVPTVDTLVAQHLLKTVAAARLMGAECILSGIRPQIAQTIVHLGVDLQDVMTKATLADAFAIALQRLELAVKPVRE